MGKEREENMEKITNAPINNQVEPDLLHHIEKQFKKWQQYADEKVTLGTREIGNFAMLLKGAALNSHLGFKYKYSNGEDETDGKDYIKLEIFTDNEQYLNEKPHFTFKAEIYR